MARNVNKNQSHFRAQSTLICGGGGQDTKSVLRSLAALPSNRDLSMDREEYESPRSMYRKRIEEMSQLRRLSQSVIVERKPDEEI